MLHDSDDAAGTARRRPNGRRSSCQITRNIPLAFLSSSIFNMVDKDTQQILINYRQALTEELAKELKVPKSVIKSCHKKVCGRLEIEILDTSSESEHYDSQGKGQGETDEEDDEEDSEEIQELQKKVEEAELRLARLEEESTEGINQAREVNAAAKGECATLTLSLMEKKAAQKRSQAEENRIRQEARDAIQREQNALENARKEAEEAAVRKRKATEIKSEKQRKRRANKGKQMISINKQTMRESNM